MSEPTTTAGRALSAAALHYQSGRRLEPEAIVAIENEAAAAARAALLEDSIKWADEAAAAARAALLDELETAVKGLPEVEDLEVGGWSRVRRNAVLAVLAEIDRRRP